MTDLRTLSALIAIAGAMVATTGVLLKWAAFARTALRASVVLFLLLMMTGMLIGAAIYYLAPGPTGLVEGLWVASALMSVAVLLVFFEFLSEARLAQAAGADHRPTPLQRTGAFLASVVTTVLVNEFLMGWIFQRAAGGPVWLGGGGLSTLLVVVLVSPWFVFPMAFEMGLTLLWLRGEFPRPMVWLLLLQPIVMVSSPPTFPEFGWVVPTAVGASAGMALAVGYLLILLVRGDPLPRPIVGYSTELLLAFGLMAGGLALWAASGEVGLYSLSIAAQMVVFLAAVIAPDRFPAAPRGSPGNTPPRTPSSAGGPTRAVLP
ncbi:MAG: hypothetical protein ACREC5_00840 [Thermoplasmata archaeon]